MIVASVAGHAVNVPWWDDWELVPLLERLRAGELSPGDLWTQHNEHRPVLPRMLMLALAWLTDWDVRVEMAAGIALALGTFAVLARLLVWTVPVPALRPWLVLATSAMLFSLVQWENWLWGWQVNVFMSVLAACVTVSVLARLGPRGPGPLLATLAAAAGALSYGGGLVLLALVPVALALDPRRRDVRRAGRATMVCAVAAAGLGTVYFVGLTHPPQHPGPLYALSHPVAFVAYALVFLGAALGSFAGVFSLACGAAGVAILAAAGSWLWQGSPARRPALLPWLLLALYAVLNAAITAVARVEWGADQARASRYTTVAALFWVSVLVLGALAVARVLEERQRMRRRALAVTAVAALAAVLGAVSYAVSWITSEEMVELRAQISREGLECLRFHRVASDACLGRLSLFEVAELRARVERLERLRLGPFSPARRGPALSAYTLATPSRTPGWVERVGTVSTGGSGSELVVSGWAADPFRDRAASTVLIVVGGEVVGRVAPATVRADVATAFGEAWASSGWSFRIPASRLAGGSHTLDAYAVTDDRRIVKLPPGSFVVQVGSRPR